MRGEEREKVRIGAGLETSVGVTIGNVDYVL